MGLNSMKSKAFQMVSYIVQLEGVTMLNNMLIESCSKLVTFSISSLNSIINEKLEYISNMSRGHKKYPDYNYEILIFQIMLFLSRFLAREPIVTQFSGFVKKYFFLYINYFFKFFFGTYN
jgi:hypothetical protein